MFHRRSSSRGAARPGKVVVLFALSVIPIMGVVAIALEGGLMVDHKRQVQAAADAAAMSAAESLFANFQTYKGADNGNKAVDAGKASAAENGFPDSPPSSAVTVNVPPLTGDHVGQKGYAEVIIEYHQPRYFSRVFGSTDTMPVRARAVARGMWSASRMGILVLDLHVPEALKANGTGTVQVANADLIVDSDNSAAVGTDGQGAIIKVTNATADLTGGLKNGTTIDGPVAFNQPPTPDPLAYLPPPSKPATANSIDQYNPNNPTAKTYLQALGIQPKDINGKVYVLYPGRYDHLPNFNNGDVVILKQASFNTSKGVYYLDGTGFTSTGATVVIDPTGATSGGVMVYNDPQKDSDGINITGGHIVLRPPTTPPFKGILFWQRRDSDIPFQITGQGGMDIYDTFNVPRAQIKITGSDSTNLDVIGSQYISRTLQTGGNGRYVVNWDPDMVAPLRQLALVE